MATLIALVTQFWPVLLGVGAAIAVLLGLKRSAAVNKQRGRLERDAEIIAQDTKLQQQMAKVEKPTEDEALRRLKEGSA